MRAQVGRGGEGRGGECGRASGGDACRGSTEPAGWRRWLRGCGRGGAMMVGGFGRAFFGRVLGFVSSRAALGFVNFVQKLGASRGAECGAIALVSQNWMGKRA